MIIAVTGDRHFDNRHHVQVGLHPYAEPGNVLLHGGAEGLDSLAHHVWTRTWQLPSVTVPAPWNRFGNQAGPIRNGAMLRGEWVPVRPDLLVVFPGGPGTANCEAQARQLKIKIVPAQLPTDL